MNWDPSNLPGDRAFSKDDIASIVIGYEEKIHYLEERIRLLQNELFGSKSEKRYPEDHQQLPIFDKPESDSDKSGIQKTIVIAEHQRKRRGRKPLPEDLPRVEIIHDIPGEEKICACGAALSRIGQDTCEKLDYIPAKMRVLLHIRYKYACKACEGVEADGPTIKIAPPPVQLLEKSMASEGLLAHIVVSKFADGLPLYRQEKIFGRLGIELKRATMANWAIAASEKCLALIELLQNEIRSGPLINIDESPLQVLDEPGRANTTKSYMWVFCGGQPEHPVVLYQYHPTRSGRVALSFLDRYQGYIQSDDFSGYNELGKKKGIVRLGCFAHVRRKFMDVIKVRKKQRGQATNVKGLADEALDLIGELYLLEKKARLEEMNFDQIYGLRQMLAKPILDKFKEWLDAKQPLTPPKGLLGQAINYALSNWDQLIVYTEDGRLKPDNNVAENAIRPFVLGRKNWLFAGNPKGAKASAIFFSLIETAKANELEPYSYLRCLFEQLPLVKKQAGYRDLLPQYIDRDLIIRSAGDLQPSVLK